MNEKDTNEQSWRLLVLYLKEESIKKYGVGWQKVIAEKANLKPSNVSRVFSMKYAPSLRNLIIIARAVELELSFKKKNNLHEN